MIAARHCPPEQEGDMGIEAGILDAPDAPSWAGQRDRALFPVLRNIGARVSEAIRLRVRDVVLEASPCAHLHGKGASSARSRCGGRPRPCFGSGSGGSPS
jgi:site-specific recombinase XerC